MRNLLLVPALAFGLTTAAHAQSSATTTQAGNSHHANIQQTGANSGTNGLGFTAGAYIDQYGGNGNEAFIIQEGNANYGKIEQNGSLNQARNLTPGDPKPGIKSVGNGNAVDVYQEGSTNDAATTTTGSNNRTDVLQKGDFNSANVGVSGNDGTADIDQVGNRNELNIRGFDSPSNDAVSLPNSNDYVVSQDGFKNRVNVMGGGSDNMITIMQDGDQNAVGRNGQGGGFLLVDGDLNTVSVSQTGNMHQAGVSVIGDNNSSTITQN